MHEDELFSDHDEDSRHILESARSLSLDDILNCLSSDDCELSASQLFRLSLLDPQELERTLKVVDALPDANRILLLENLEDLTQSSTLVDFKDLFTHALQDTSPDARRRALRGLLESDDETLIAEFIKLLTADASPEVQAQAAEALAGWVYLYELDELDEAVGQHITESLLKVLNGKHHDSVRRRALEAIGFSSSPAASAWLEKAFAETDEDWLASALLGMGRSGLEKWQPNVLEMLDHANNQVRLQAARAAGDLALEDAVPALLTLLEDDDEDIRLAAAWSLSETAGEGAREGLESALARAEDEVEIEYLEDALENLRFNESAEHFDLFAFNPEDLDPGDEDLLPGESN